MKITLKRYYIILNSTLVVLVVLLNLLFTNIYIKDRFKDYVKMNEEAKINIIAEEIGMQRIGKGNWNQQNLRKIALRALSEGYIISVRGNCGSSVWTQESYLDDECKVLLKDMSGMLEDLFNENKGIIDEQVYQIFSNGENVAEMRLQKINSAGYGNNEIWYLKILNSSVIVIGIFLLILFGGITYYFGAKMSREIKGIEKAAEKVSRGEKHEDFKQTSSILEIESLKESISNMAYSLHEQREVQKRITADSAHELRTPIATLLSHIEAVMDGVWEPTIERMQVCHEEVMRMKRLIDNLWKLTKYEQDNAFIKKEKVDLSTMMNHIKKVFSHNDKYIWRIESGIFAEVDKDKLQQAIINIMENADKYGGNNIDIELYDDKEKIYLTISDDGEGMDEETKKNIFQRFYRGDKSRKSHSGGAGIGLTIAESAVALNGGKIRVESELGKGTKFIIEFFKKNSI